MKGQRLADLEAEKFVDLANAVPADNSTGVLK